jgi:hypothetical protein
MSLRAAVGIYVNGILTREHDEAIGWTHGCECRFNHELPVRCARSSTATMPAVSLWLSLPKVIRLSQGNVSFPNLVKITPSSPL